MIVIFPMAGLSSRFCKAGYKKPKYMLEIQEKSVFYYAVKSFRYYFNDFKFLFIYRNIENTTDFIHHECSKLGLESYQMVQLTHTTQGQAHTCYLGLEQIKNIENESLLIFNIDTFRPNFTLPKMLDFSQIDGYLEVFEGLGEHWSFVLPSDIKLCKVAKTAEKNRISSLCSSGLYYFRNMLDFKESFLAMQQTNSLTHNEFYIAPLYNYLIQKGKDIRYFKISLSEIVFCGIPEEYEQLLLNPKDSILQ